MKQSGVEQRPAWHASITSHRQSCLAVYPSKRVQKSSPRNGIWAYKSHGLQALAMASLAPLSRCWSVMGSDRKFGFMDKREPEVLFPMMRGMCNSNCLEAGVSPVVYRLRLVKTVRLEFNCHGATVGAAASSFLFAAAGSSTCGRS